MTNITINTDRGYIGMILSASADAICFTEREIEECPADATEYREFVQGKLEHHRVLNQQIGTLFLKTRPGLFVDGVEDDE